MQNNPFVSPTSGRVLEKELCQRLHYEALARAAHERHTEAVPPTLDLTLLRALARLLGSEVYLASPELIEELFAGITTGVYRLIVELYCSRLERSIDAVWRIVQALAYAAGKAAIPYETVWTLCMHLQEHRRLQTAVSVEHDAAGWRIVPLSCVARGSGTAETDSRYLILCVFDDSRKVVLAFRVVEPHYLGEAYGLVLYDALVGQRRPDSAAAAGISWHVPERLFAQQEMTPDHQGGCTRLGISVERAHEVPAIMHMLEAGFQQEVRSRALTVDRLTQAFDSYLHKTLGYSPVRDREERDRDYLHLVGYNRDPAWLCPAIRSFLPLHNGLIAHDGTIPFDGLHYADELLPHWADSSVTFRRSEQTEALIWVYLQDSILCEAMARELRRRDGSYRPQRPGR